MPPIELVVNALILLINVSAIRIQLENNAYLKRLVFLRKQASMSQTDVAGYLNIDYSTLGKIEKGDISLSVDRAMALAKIYGVSISELLDDENLTSKSLNAVAEDAAEYGKGCDICNITFQIGGDGKNSAHVDRFLNRLGSFLMDGLSDEERDALLAKTDD